MVLCCVFVGVVNPFRNTNISLRSGPYRNTPRAKSSPGTSLLTARTDVWTPGPACGSVIFMLYKVDLGFYLSFSDGPEKN